MAGRDRRADSLWGASAMIRSRVLSTITALTVGISTVALHPLQAAAVTPDPGIEQLAGFLSNPTGSVQDWSKGLGTIGKLADALPAVQSSPGAAVGFGDLLDKAFTTGTKKLSDAQQDADLGIDQDVPFGDGRTGHLKVALGSVSGGKSLSVHLTMSHDVVNQPLSFAVPIGGGSNAPQSAFSSTGGVTLTVSADLTFDLVWEQANNAVYLKVDNSGTATPALKVDAHAAIANMAAVKAAVGILGIGLVAGSMLTLDAHFQGSVSDPNNDGKLYFVNPDASTGELGQNGSLAGLVNFGFANPAGELHATLNLETAATGGALSLPAVQGSITIDWGDISIGTPTITPNLAGVGKFLNMTPRDLAVGIAQLVTSLTSMQQANKKDNAGNITFGNFNLPFLKGSLADSIKINDQLKQFLLDWTFPMQSDTLHFNTVPNEHHPGPADDPAKGGEPKFVSLQEFFEKLNGTCANASVHICVSDINYTDPKLAFKISLHQSAPALAVDLNPSAGQTSGGAGTTYDATHLTDPGKSWTPNQFKDLHVVAGSSGATILSNTATTLTLAAPGWTPVVPTNSSSYAISGAAGDVGQVQLGDSLKIGGKGIGGVNAVNASAKVTPSYDAALTLVLDLQNPTVLPTPQEVHNPDGSTTIVNATPTGADRVLLRTTGGPTLFTADFPMSADVDIFANAGFLQVRLAGGLKVCHKNAGADCNGALGVNDHMLKVSLVDNGDMTFGQVVAKLLSTGDPAQLLSFDTEIRAGGSVAVSVPQASTFLSGGATANASFSWNDITQFTGADGPQFNTSDLSEFVDFDFDPSNPRALYSIILKTLQTLSASLSDADTPGAAIFNTKLPVVGRSLKELLKADESGMGPQVTFEDNALIDASRTAGAGNLFDNSKLKGRTIVVGTQVAVIKNVASGATDAETATGNKLVLMAPWTAQPANGTAYVMRSELDDLITLLQAAPPDNVQALIELVNARLKDSTPFKFEYKKVDLNNPTTVDPSDDTPSLIIRMDWQRNYHTSAPFKFDFDGNTFAGLQGSGSFSVDVGGRIKVGLVIPLQTGDGPADASALKILDDSSVGVKLDASVDNGTIAANLGPLSLSLGNPQNGGEKATAKASYSLDLAKSGGTGAPTSFADFLGAVGPTLNATSNNVDCNLPDKSTPTNLALCAKLPLYFSTDGTNYSPLITESPGHSNSFAIRLPKTSSVSDAFDFSGAQIDGHDRLEAPAPADITAALAAAALNFTQLDSIDAYLNLIETSLNAASFGGKLPLIGDDLQQGADFVGKVRAAMRDALNTLKGDHPDGNVGSDTTAVRNALNGYISNALTSANVPSDLLTVDTECKTTLDPVALPTITNQGTPGGKTYKYKVASYTTDSGNTKHEAKPSPEATTNTGADPLDGTNFNRIAWTPVTGADGYRVFKDDGSGTFKLLKDVAGQASNQADDKGESLGTDEPQDPAQNPKIHSCSATDLDAVIIRLDLHQGDFTGGNFTCPVPSNDPHDCFSKTVPLDIGIPGLSLKAADDGDGPTVSLGYQLHLAFGISFKDGFFINANDQGPDTPELGLGLNFKLSSGDINAQLAFINITAHNCTTLQADQDLGCGHALGATTKDLFNGQFSINLKAPGGADRLKLADLSSASLDDLFKVKLSAEVAVDWLLKARPGTEGMTGFPGIQAEFQLHWKWVNADPGSNGSSGGSEPLSIAFKDVAIDTGEVFGQILSPIVNKIKQVLGPLDPVIKTLYAPIPVLSDLSHLVGGDDVTLLSIAKAFSTLAGGPDLTMVERIIAIIDFINKFPTCTTSCRIPLGSFDVAGSKALDTNVTPDNTESLITNKKDKNNGTAFNSVLGDLESKNSNSQSTNPLSGSNSKAAKSGFSFPVFDNPASLFNLLMGGDVDLIKYDSGPLTLAFDWRQEFGPVYAPPPVVITLHGSASVTLHIVAGFDTYGIRKAFEKVKAGNFNAGDVGAAILQSLFFYTNDADGKPIPVVQFNGEIAAGAAVTAVIITVGIEGGVGLTISFLWNDPNHDGKFRISEFLAVALNNPLCLFSVSGRIYVFLKLYITIGFSPFSVSFSFTIVDVTLLDFSVAPDCQPPPPKLGGLSSDGKTLVVYAGAYGHTAQRGGGSSNPYEDNNQEKDTIKITSLHEYEDPTDPSIKFDPPHFKGIAVDMLGIRREFLNTAIERVVVVGTGYTKPMSITFIGDAKQSAPKNDEPPPPTASFDKDAVVFGGNGNDQIKTGIGNSWVFGGPGDDIIVTGDRTVLDKTKDAYVLPNSKAIVAGGGGADSITVGNGTDVVGGDSNLGTATTSLSLKELKNDGTEGGDPTEVGPTLSVPNWNALSNPSDGTDQNGAGTDGMDVVNVGLGASTAFGNGGNDTLGVAADNPLADTNHTHSLFVSAGTTLVGGDGADNIAAGTGDDKIYTAAKPVADPGIDDAGPTDNPTAADPADGPVNTVDTGTGNDKVFGGTGVDRVTSHSKKDQSSDIRGGGGDDILVGGFGTDAIYGGPDDDYVLAEPSKVVLPDVAPPSTWPNDGFGPALTVTHLPLPQGITSSHKTLVGGLGADHIVGGDAGADIYGDQKTTPCVAGNPVASDPVDESVNTVNDGNDLITGGAGVENVRAGGGNDNVDVKANNDLACGEKGDDTLKGGSEDDQIWGGSGKDVINGDTGLDKLYGNDGNDSIYGGNQVDSIEGNDGADSITGGDDNDVILGGTRAAARADTGDTLYGDNGTDTIIGDNGDFVAGAWRPLDLDGLNAGYGGKDTIFGGNDNDLGYGGLDNDTMFGGAADDHFEGNNADDTIYGESGEDELVGGGRFSASAGVGYPDGVDHVYGGPGTDAITGDNALVDTVATGDSTDTVKGRAFPHGHTIALLDLGYSPAGANSDGDFLYGEDSNDVIYGQGGGDTISGGNSEDYAEGGPGVDTINGNDGEDDLVGGSSTKDSTAPDIGQPDTGDIIHGDNQADVIIGDNGKVLRGGPANGNPAPHDVTNRSGMTNQRAIVLYDLGEAPHANSSGGDDVTGDAGVDVVFGQGGNDRLKGNTEDDYVEGDQGSDWIEGDTGDDDLIGGSSTPQSGSGDTTVGQFDSGDAVYGGPGDDAVIGDNARLLRIGDRTRTFDRLGSTAGTRMTARNLALFDLGANYLTTPSANRFGDDRLSGGGNVDVIYGQDGNDQISGGPSNDYLEGNGGIDILQGDRLLFTAMAGRPATTQLVPNPAWPGVPSGAVDLEGSGPDGQDDQLGGSSLKNFRDDGDFVEGDGEGDFQLGDNGVLKRDLQGAEPNTADRLFLKRYPANAVPANAVAIRIGDPTVNSNGTTRFCDMLQATCEKAGASGNDTMWGDGGDDTMWGQDGNDTMRGGDNDDNMYGELGDDTMFGENGNDAMLGDRGGIVDQYEDGSRQYAIDVTQVPKVHYDGFVAGTVTRTTDLQHDINGDVFVGSSTSAAMPHRGDTEGGVDRMRGGNGEDAMHGGFGDDLMNGDSGGDELFGDDGADLVWGGKGCDAAIDTLANNAGCFTGGLFDPSGRGNGDNRVDYLLGGKGGTSAESIAGSSGSDLLDWHPRGTYGVPGPNTCAAGAWPQTFGNGSKNNPLITEDPCSWFEMTDLNDADVSNNQHHQGIDWMYGGWDRDVLQGDVADNGPNPGDRLLDWNGAYNLYTHCNSAYGGYNDVRQHSPSWQNFLQQWVFSLGAGQLTTDAANGTAGVGTSAFDELALVYPGVDNDHGSGSAYPTTPGHFDNPNACAP